MLHGALGVRAASGQFRGRAALQLYLLLTDPGQCYLLPALQRAGAEQLQRTIIALQLKLYLVQYRLAYRLLPQGVQQGIATVTDACRFCACWCSAGSVGLGGG